MPEKLKKISILSISLVRIICLLYLMLCCLAAKSQNLKDLSYNLAFAHLSFYERQAKIDYNGPCVFFTCEFRRAYDLDLILEVYYQFLLLDSSEELPEDKLANTFFSFTNMSIRLWKEVSAQRCLYFDEENKVVNDIYFYPENVQIVKVEPVNTEKVIKNIINTSGYYFLFDGYHVMGLSVTEGEVGFAHSFFVYTTKEDDHGISLISKSLNEYLDAINHPIVFAVYNLIPVIYKFFPFMQSAIYSSVPHACDLTSNKIASKNFITPLGTALRELNVIDTDINVKNHDDVTELYLLVSLNQVKRVKSLLANNADINIRTNTGISPIFIAVMKNNIELIELFLLHEDIDLFIRDNKGYDIMHYAAKFSSQEVLFMLLANGAQGCGVANNGDRPLDLARMYNRSANIDFLRKLCMDQKKK